MQNVPRLVSQWSDSPSSPPFASKLRAGSRRPPEWPFSSRNTTVPGIVAAIRPTVSRLLASQYQYFTSRGAVSSRTQTLSFLSAPDYVLEQAKRSESHRISLRGLRPEWPAVGKGRGPIEASRSTTTSALRSGIVAERPYAAVTEGALCRQIAA